MVLAVLLFGAILRVVGTRIDGHKLDESQRRIGELQEQNLQLTAKNFEVSEQNLKWVTGGTDFVDVTATWAWEDPDWIWFNVENNGHSPAYDVKVSIFDRDKYARLDKDWQIHRTSPSSQPLFDNFASSTRVFKYPILYGQDSLSELFKIKYSLKGRNDRSFGVDVQARNGERHYSFKLAHVTGGQKDLWLIAMKDSGKSIMGTFGKSVETVPPEFPLDSNGKVDWDHGKPESADEAVVHRGNHNQ